MMPSLVLDCSVTIAWLMPDESSGVAVSILEQVAERGAIVPSIWPLEVGNVLLIAQRAKRITLEQRQKALYILRELPIIIDADTSIHAWLETTNLAEQHNLTLYDSSYLELALRTSKPLATFDNALKKAAKIAKVNLSF